MISLGRRSGFPYNHSLMDLIAEHSHTMWCPVSSSIPHFLRSGSDAIFLECEIVSEDESVP